MYVCVFQIWNFLLTLYIYRKFREEPGSLITISMIDLPKQRYVRRNVKTILDVVSKYFFINICTFTFDF